MREVTEIRIDEYGDEIHESWILIGAHHISSTGTRLFDSEIPHQHFVGVTVKRCTRKRRLNHDWLHGTKTLLEFHMSQAQWGAFVSSFGQGDGVPATLTFLTDEGVVPSAPDESRLAESHQDVLNSGTKAVENISQSYDRVMQAFEAGGKKALREELRGLGFAIQNAPRNMEFAAKSLTEHVEKVVTKARADIEAQVVAASQRGEISEGITTLQLEAPHRDE